MQQACQGFRLSDVPTWHTRLLIVLLLGVATTGALLGSTTASGSRLTSVYLPLVVVAVGLALYVSRIGLPRSVLRELLVVSWRPLDTLVAAGLVCIVLGLEHAFTLLTGSPESLAAHALVPISPLETAAWLVVAAIVGTSEELVYRGYLQKRLGSLSGSVAWGILLQAMLFGIAHGEQGGLVVARFGFYGLLFGAVAAWRGSIAVGVAAHVAIDWWAACAS